MKDGLAAKGRRITYRDSVVTVTAGKYVYLENCRRIIEYNDIRIAVELTDAQLHIWGKDLRADCCETNTLIVYGEIQSIEWIRKGANKK
ncbi:MAG: YabP/YqfC family sporulation protein [Ruminococcus sp.]|nr:YabP/YqfC family sporulation protein [Ruminococcus sp.]